MDQKLVQTQVQKQLQVQRLSQQQMLQVRLLEMPLTELEESVNAELDDNPALEASSSEDAMADSGFESIEEEREEMSEEEQNEHDDREEALENALENIGRDDRMPESYGYTDNDNNADYEEVVYGDTVSFYDKLKEQMGETVLTDRQQDIMEYIIGSLDDDGLLRKDLESISDELAVYHNIDADTEEIEQVLRLLQAFDPAGIGARSLQECLR